MTRAPRPQSKGLQALHDRYIGDDPEKVDAFETAKNNAEMARAIYRLRKKSGLTQRQLATLVGTTPSVICRLEDADYDGHSLSMLTRIAKALGRGVEIRFTPAVPPQPPKAASKAQTPKAPTAPKVPKAKALPSPPKAAKLKRVAASKKRKV